MVKEFRQVIRDRGSLAVLLFVPAFLLVMFGYALNFDVRHIKMAVCDLDKSRLSREFIDHFTHSEYFDFAYQVEEQDEIDKLLARERVKVGLIIPQNFSDKVYSGENVSVQVIVDGANASSAATTVGYVNLAMKDYSQKINTSIMMRRGNNEIANPIDFRPRIWYNPELLSIKFLIPGLISFILMMVTVISTALSVVREKEKNTMEQLIVSPVKPVELILGKTVPFLMISFTAALIILIVGHLLFDVSVKGSIALLFIVTLVFLLGSLGMGLLISTIAHTQQVAFMMSILTTFLPTFLLSGFVFPIRNMPFTIQVITYIVPAKYYLVALRNIIIKGSGFFTFWDQFLFLVIFAFLTIVISSRRLRRDLSLGMHSHARA